MYLVSQFWYSSPPIMLTVALVILVHILSAIGIPSSALHLLIHYLFNIANTLPIFNILFIVVNWCVDAS